MALALHLQLALVAAARGDEARLGAAAGHHRRLRPHGRPVRPARRHRRARGAPALAGRAKEAHRITREALDQLADQQDAGLVISMCSLALRAHADLVTSRADRLIRESAAHETAHLLAIAQDARRRHRSAGPRPPVAVPGRGRTGLDDALGRRVGAVVAAWQQLECPYPAAYAQWRQARSCSARGHGRRAPARSRPRCRRRRRLAVRAARASLRTLARLAGVPPDALDAAPAEAAPRSRRPEPSPLAPGAADAAGTDVLRMLTEGFTNQQIARRLFITESTVSVHVSHIIAKLGVSNRLQAAAAAHRLNLFPQSRNRCRT